MSTPLAPIRRHLPTAVALATATLAMLAPAAAQAHGATTAVCVNRLTLTISPGFSLTPTSGTETTHGDTGAIACVGLIRGHRVTGVGSIGVDTTYTRSSCVSEFSVGRVRVTIPTVEGTERIDGTLTVWRTALVVRVEVLAPHIRFSGIGLAVPTDGTCVLSPLRQVLISITGLLSGT